MATFVDGTPLVPKTLQDNVGLQTMHMGFEREDWITGSVAGKIGERRAVSGDTGLCFWRFYWSFLLKGGIRRLSLGRDRKRLGEKKDRKPDISWLISFPSFTAIWKKPRGKFSAGRGGGREPLLDPERGSASFGVTCKGRVIWDRGGVCSCDFTRRDGRREGGGGRSGTRHGFIWTQGFTCQLTSSGRDFLWC